MSKDDDPAARRAHHGQERLLVRRRNLGRLAACLVSRSPLAGLIGALPLAGPVCRSFPAGGPRLFAAAVGSGLVSPVAAVPSLSFTDAVRRLAGGPHVVMIRHADTEPGVGDPAGYRLDDCRSQRNLSAQGREQSRRIGAAFARSGLRIGEVRASAWCRCRDTADLAFGRHQLWASLNSFFDNRAIEAANTAAVKALIAAYREPALMVLVTHQVNISAVSGSGVAMGHAVAMPGGGGTGFGFDPLG